MGKSSRNKGHAYEREVRDALNTGLGASTSRHLGQARDGGADVVGLPPFTIECKRRSSLAVYGWLDQATRATTPEAPVPVVIARGDHRESLVIMRLTDWMKLADAYRQLFVEGVLP